MEDVCNDVTNPLTACIPVVNRVLILRSSGGSLEPETKTMEIKMRRFPQLAAFFIALSLTLGPTLVSMAAGTAGKMLDDSTITASVKTQLAKDLRAGTLTGIEVNTTNGVVTLAGKVKSNEERKAAERIASRVEGVKEVKDNLQVVS